MISQSNNTKISLIAAMDLNRGIGFNNSLPWSKPIPADWEHLFRVTEGKKMIMGRKSFDNPHRVASNAGNIVLSSEKDLILPNGFILANSIAEALDIYINEDEVFIIGGQQLFEQSIEFADEIYLTVVLDRFKSDTFFPEFNKERFKVNYIEQHNDKGSYPIEIYHYIKI